MIYDKEENKFVCAELSKVGFQISSIYDLVNSKENYPEAIPILIKMLPKVKSDRMKEGIARALTVKNAGRKVAQVLLSEFENYYVCTESEEAAKWAIANALSVVADNSHFEEIVRLVRDKGHGKSREMLVQAISKIKDPKVIDILIELLTDENLAGYAIIALGKLKSKNAAPYIQKFLEHSETWIRKEASRALKKIL